MLPNEQDAKAAIRQEITCTLDLIDAAISHYVWIVEEGQPTADVEATPVSNRVAMGLAVRACKLLRQARHAATIGSGESLQLLSRSLFETAMAVRFVLAESLPIPLKKGDVSPGTEKRAMLYVGYQCIKKWDEYQKHMASPSEAPVFANLDPTTIKTDADAASKSVGADWTAIFRQYPYTYSGLGIRQLAKELGSEFQKYYRTIYAMECEVSHASDLFRHTVYRKDEKRFVAKWQDEPVEIHSALIPSALTACCVFHDLHERFQFDGVDSQILMQSVAILNNLQYGKPNK